jgi:trehalose 6-phosphate synthase
VSAVGSAAVEGDALWVCAALSEADRRAARAAPGGRVARGVELLDIEPVTFDRAYNAVANSTLWFVSHLLYDTASSPSFGARSRREWRAYREYDAAFADALAGLGRARRVGAGAGLPPGPGAAAAARAAAGPADRPLQPHAVGAAGVLLPAAGRGGARGAARMLGADAVGFHARRWADAFARCCVEVLGASYDGEHVEHAGRRTRVSVHALGVDADELSERAAQGDVQSRLPGLRELVGDRQLVLRIDRTELSKNIVRGLEAFRELLRTRPQWRERVVHLAFAYPSRHDLPEYREYTGAVQRVTREVNEEFATDGWLPVHLEVRDDYPRSLAAFELADVLIVNPLRDGMNLVAKEGPVLSSGGCRSCCPAGGGGRRAGRVVPAGQPLRRDADGGRAARALSRAGRTRRERTAALARAATALPPAAWLAAQLAALPG